MSYLKPYWHLAAIALVLTAFDEYFNFTPAVFYENGG
jgi:hypothetical protein